MIHRNWSNYRKDLDVYRAAKARYEDDSRLWHEKVEEFDDKTERELHLGCGWMLVFIAAGIWKYKAIKEVPWPWIWSILSLAVLYEFLHDQNRIFKKKRFLSSVPKPEFLLEEPSYEPPQNEEVGSRPPNSREHALSLEMALSILGLASLPTVESLKQSYREKIKEYHPDRVAHLGPEIRIVAEKKTKEINAAYELVEKYLGST